MVADTSPTRSIIQKNVLEPSIWNMYYVTDRVDEDESDLQPNVHDLPRLSVCQQSVAVLLIASPHRQFYHSPRVKVRRRGGSSPC